MKSLFVSGLLLFAVSVVSAAIFGLSFVAAFIMALNLALFLNAPGTPPVWGLIVGLLTGIGWVALALGTSSSTGSSTRTNPPSACAMA